MINADIRKCADYCESSYNDLPLYVNADNSCRVHLYEDGDFLVFEGTRSLGSVMADADVETVKTALFGDVHSGFWDSLNEIVDIISADTKPRIITGHSLGAAHAILYASILASRGIKASVCCIEPPRVSCGDTLAKFVSNHNIDVIAIRNGYDIVTELPSWMQHPYKLTEVGEPEWGFDNIDDHSIDNAKKAIYEFF